MIRYFLIWREFLKMSWMADMEYRLNIVVKVLADIVWYLAQISIFEVIYQHTNNIGGWNLEAMRVFMGTLFLVDAIYMILFHENFDHFSSLVRKGDLDMYFSKPVNSQFMVSCRKLSAPYLVNVLFLSGFVAWAFSQTQVAWAWYQLPAYLLFVVCGVMVVYSIRFSFCSLALIFHNAQNLGFLFFQVYRVGMRPDVFYPKWLRVIIFTIIPVALFVSVPARVLVEGINFKHLAIAPAVACSAFLFTTWIWNRTLKHYSSASS